MKLPINTMQSPLAYNLSKFDDNQIDTYNNVPMEAVIENKAAYIAFNSPWDKHHPNKPYLHIIGQLSGLNGTLPYGIDGVIYQDKQQVDMYYDFDKMQLASLVAKGLYEPNFKVPDAIKDSEMNLLVDCNFKILKPENSRDLPIMFGQIDNLRNIEINYANSGYDLAKYFEVAKPIKEQTETLDNSDQLDDTNIIKAPEYVTDDHQDNLISDDEIKDPEMDNTNNSDNLIDEAAFKAKDKDDTNNRDQAKNDANKSENKIDPETKKLLESVRKRIRKQNQRVKKQAQMAKKNKTQKTKQKSNSINDDLSDNKHLTEVYANKMANDQAEFEKSGAEQETIPETAFDFDAIGDDNVEKGRKQANKRKKQKQKQKNSQSQKQAKLIQTVEDNKVKNEEDDYSF